MSKLVIELAGDLKEMPNLEELTVQRLPTGQLLLMTSSEAAIVTGVTMNGSSTSSAPRSPRNTRRGSAHPNSRLTEDDVRIIRKRYADGDLSSTIANETGINVNTIHAVISGRTWKHVTADAEEAA